MFLRKPLVVRISVILLAAGLLASFTLISTAGASVSLTFNPAADAYVRSDLPSTNYGSGTSLRVDSSPVVNSYLRFTVSGVGGATVTQASLRIYANSASTQGLVAKSVSSNSWSETSINYSNAPATGSTLSTSKAVATGSWVSLDVTSFVKGDGTFTFGVSTPGSTAISLAARESGANAPKLIVTAGSSTTPTVTAAGTPKPTAIASGTASTIKHIFVVVMENHSYNQVWNTSASPYITSLGNAYPRATNYTAITHPSLPNYLDLYGGSNYSITTDCSPSSSCHINAKNLADNLNAKGLSWKGYMESMPSNCGLTTSGNYAPKHDPFVYFDDIRTNTSRCDAGVVPFTALATDLKSASTTPNFAFITPNLCNDMHNCSVATGDAWLKSHLPAILNSPACIVDKCLLALTWDEDDGSQGNKVLTIFAGSGAKTGGVVSAKTYNHFSLLKTVEAIFGLPTQTAKDAAASSMTDMLR